ncbi:MAG: O-antigen ligase family protein [Ilumatobacteraceae bacterium]
MVVDDTAMATDEVDAEPDLTPEPDDGSGPSWATPVAWIGAIVLFLVASGGPVTWARAELADVTGPLISDIWVQAILVVSAGLVLAFSAAGWDLLRHDRLVLGSVGVLLAVLLFSAAWSLDGTRTVEQWILLVFASAAALFGGVALERTQVLTALFLAVHVGILVSVVADLRDWPVALVGDDLAGVFGSTDMMGMIALLAAAATVMIMVAVLRRTPEERLAIAEEKAARGGGGGGFRMPSMGSINKIRRAADLAQRGQSPASSRSMTPSTPGQAMQFRTMARAQKRRSRGSLAGVRSSNLMRIGVSVLLVTVLVLDAFIWWRTQSYGSLFAIVATAIVMLVVGLSLPGAGEGGRRAAAGIVSVIAAAGAVLLVVFRETVAEQFDRAGTWSGRTTLWDGVLDGVADRPIHGFGFEAGAEAAGFGTRSGFLQILVAAGAIGLIALVWLMALTLRRTASGALLRPDALGVWVVGMAAYGIAANVNESFVSAWSLPWLLLLFALGHAVRRREERDGAIAL